jgi:organic radical activating enzyme
MRTYHDDQLPPGIVSGMKTLSVMPTFTCPAACNNCGTLSSPSERTSLSLDRALETIREAKHLGFGLVVFTGGETTLRWDETLEGIALASSLGMLTRVVTNAHWARSLEVARDRIDKFIAAGLSEINYSTGDEHVRFVPLDRVATACVAAAERALRVHVMIELTAARTIRASDLLGHPLIAQLPLGMGRYISVVESPWMPLNQPNEKITPRASRRPVRTSRRATAVTVFFALTRCKRTAASAHAVGSVCVSLTS